MKTIKDAVIELGGVWRDKNGYLTKEDDLLLREFGFLIVGNSIFNDDRYFICTKSEFESCAKRLGYINGYRWGVEYPTNGKRPDLPDDVLIDIKTGLSNVWLGWTDMDVTDAAWTSEHNAYPATHFKVIDQRYKPADTSYLNVQPQDHIVEADEKVDESWHERGELPPVGEKIEYTTTEYQEGKPAIEVGKWYFGKIIAYHNGFVWTSDNGIRKLSVTKFRPIRTEREKVIEAAEIVLKNAGWTQMTNVSFKAIDALYNAGMLVLPPKKSDTKD